MIQIKNSVKRFASDERGGLSNLILPMFLLLVLTTGWAIDLILHETERADLQDSLDRGVLAAASVSQTQDRKTVIQEYVDKRPFGRTLEEDQESSFALRPDVVLPVDTNTTEQSAIEAHAIYDFPTVFANIVFHDSYPIPAVSTAEEGIRHVEISLVLDISASMAQNDQTDPNQSGIVRSRLAILQDAAKFFVTELLGNGTRQRVSISLVPYSGAVNPGILYDDLALTANEDLSPCLNFQLNDFTYTGFPAAQTLTQIPNFNYFIYTGDFAQDGVSYTGPDNNSWGWCPTSSPVIPMTRDLNKLTTAIDNFSGHDGTGTDVAMKYGLALLDPTTQPIIYDLAQDPANGIPADFANRPLEFGAPGVRKIIVLLTDGNIRYQPRPNPDQLTDPDLLEMWGVAGGGGQEIDYAPGFYGKFGAYYPGNIMARGNNREHVVVGGNSLAGLTGTQRNNILDADEALRTSQFVELCRLARAEEGVRVFTIAFDVAAGSAAYNEMNRCAATVDDFDPSLSQANDFFHVTNGNLKQVLDQIKELVLSLRLTK